MSIHKARRLRDAVRRLIVAHEVLAEAKRPCGAPLSLPHAYALLELLHAPEPMTVSMLAQTLAIDRTNVSRLCARLELAGEVVREKDPTDGRAVVLRLTPHGEEVARSVDTSSAKHFAGLVRALGGANAPAVIDALEQLEQAMAAVSAAEQEST